MKIGIILSSLRMEIREALKTAKQLGAAGVQLRNVGGDLDPEVLNTKTAREEFKNYVASIGLEISALCGDLGRGGYVNPNEIEWMIARTKQMMDLAVDLESPIITTHIGVIPEDETKIEYKTMFEALKEMSKYAEKTGTFLAAETGPEDTTLMKKMFDKLGSKGIKINYDPANLVGRGYDHIKGVEVLKDYIIHTHAKDAIRTPEGKYQEKELGGGAVNFPKYISVLNSIGYKGYYTVEREIKTGTPSEIVSEAIQFLRKLDSQVK